MEENHTIYIMEEYMVLRNDVILVQHNTKNMNHTILHIILLNVLQNQNSQHNYQLLASYQH